MGLQIVQHRSGQNYRIGKPGEDLTLVEVYKVTWKPDAGQPTYPGDGAVLASASSTALSLPVRVPKVQERYAGCDGNLSFLVCESVDWRVDPAVQYSWTVTATWTSRMEFMYADQAEGTLPKTWTRITRTSQMRQMPVWRTGAPIPNFGTWVWPPATDIGGTKVDIGGQPMIRNVPQTQIVIEWRYDRTFIVDENGDPMPEPSQNFAGWLGIRNSATFLNFEKDYVVCNGMSFSPVNDQTYIAQFRFLFDWLAHYEQKPAPNTANITNLVVAPSNFCGLPYQVANKVGWFQPYPDVEDLNLMFPPHVYDALMVALPPTNSCVSPPRDLGDMSPDYTSFPAFP